MGRKNNNRNKGRGTNNKKNKNGSIAKAGSMNGNFHSFDADESYGDGSGSGDYYGIYKRSTTKFWNWMKETLPNSRLKAVNDLIRGVEKVHERTMRSLQEDNNLQQQPGNSEVFVAPKRVIEELSKSIQYRQLVTDNRFEAAAVHDEGHSYMIDALKYCRHVLRYGRRVAKVAAIQTQHEQKGGNVDRISNPFSSLIIDDDEGEEEKEDTTPIVDIDKIRNGTLEPVPFESPVSKGEEIDIETLINGDDRFQCLALLNTLDDYMGIVHKHYGLLKKHLREIREKKEENDENDESDDGVLKLLMECSVVANMATTSIRTAENSLKIDHPHILSFYHVLTIVFMPNYVVDIDKMLAQNDDDDDCRDKFGSEKERRHAVIDFVANLVESAFHNRPNYGRGLERFHKPHVTNAVKAFTRKFGVKSKTEKLNAEIAQPLFFYVMTQTHLNIEKGYQIESRSWLKNSAHIGRDASILNTQNLIQIVVDCANSKSKLVSRAGFWGSKFDEWTNPAERIQGDLDEVLGGCILPEICFTCLNSVPNSPHLLTLYDLLKHHLKKDNIGPVPISVTFAFHALLTSMVVLQGDGDLARIRSVAKESYNKLFSQLDDLADRTIEPTNTPNFYKNVIYYKQLVLFPKSIPVDYCQSGNREIIDPKVVENYAYWNPLIAGENMLLCAYLCSWRLGSAMCDTLGQLRLTLHLYNALKNRDPSIARRIPFLDKVDRLFSKTKSVWACGRPDKGSYAKNFFMSWGHSISRSKELASEYGKPIVEKFRKSFANRSIARSIDEMLPENYTASYNCVVKHIFPDDASLRECNVQNSTKESPKEDDGLHDLLARVKMTRNAMDKDEDYFSLNITAVGCILLKFTNALSKEMGWYENCQGLPNSLMVRGGRTKNGRIIKPGNFKISDLNIIRQGESYYWGTVLSHLDHEPAVEDKVLDNLEKVSAFTEKFFSNVRREEYNYFVKVSDRSFMPERRNPLKGPYPYGRTGLTMDEPLQGYVCAKFNKSGNLDSRMIYPGKLTPFKPDAEGFAQPIIRERGDDSKVVRLPNGKYRHIASYKLDELIDLGWDGSWYLAKRGKHGATDMFVPFIDGYDSDEEEEYEPFDVEAGKRAGTIGCPVELKGKYMVFREPGLEPTFARIT